MAREPFTVLEIDMGKCGRSFGVGACTASLGGRVDRKCYRTFGTCWLPSAYLEGVQTLRYCTARAPLPDNMGPMFPALQKVSAIGHSVNIAGADASLGPTGRRAEVRFELADFVDHDRLTDPYQAERISGAAQADGIGYDPSRGTHFGKLRLRWPHYTARPARLLQGYIEGDAFVDVITRNFVLSAMAPPDDQGRVIVEAEDPLALLDSDRAVYPPASQGALLADIAADATGCTLTPAGVGATYAAAGELAIGGEIIAYTRSGDVVTFTQRDVAGTGAEQHSAGDVAQEVAVFDGVRIDDAYARLCLAAPGFPPALLPLTAWAAEVGRWMPEFLLRTRITTPTGISKLIGELSICGVSIYWNDVAQLVGLKVNRPPDGDTVYDLTQDNALLSIRLESRNADRITDVIFASVQLDPAKSATDYDNYARATWRWDDAAKDPRAYGDTRIRRIFSRWFNGGADDLISILVFRFLRRFRAEPIRAHLTLDAKDRGIGLTDVLRLTTPALQDVTGAAVPGQWQVFARSDPIMGGPVELSAQSYQWAGRYGYAAPDTATDYDTATAAEQAVNEYACDDSLTFSDGSGPYEAI